jgi:hypothetical protein
MLEIVFGESNLCHGSRIASDPGRTSCMEGKDGPVPQMTP